MRLGEIYMSRSAGADAEAAFQRALSLDPENAGLNARVGFLYYERGADDLARVYLGRAHRLDADEEGVAWTLKILDDQAEPEPPPPAPPQPKPPTEPPETQPPADPEPEPDLEPDAEAPPPPDDTPSDTCTLPLSGGNGRPLSLEVAIEGAPVEFLLDTGATLTVITAELADRLSLPLDRDRIIRASTANGIAEMRVALIDEITLGEVSLTDVSVAVCEDCMHGLGEGLFGLDLQEAFEVDLDLGARQIHYPCE